ncbi:MAG: hypothetical protein HOI23_05270 [Deltaproteobacteria bacterium]|nr:hypothetical protein [Deltaproteobacteria bacterium]MBT6434987.1 hypothetical protein [Deltaproteobacteria bacterium]MBT6492552.1 hypothetical protein [Deltaproteobacteria bacterium]
MRTLMRSRIILNPGLAGLILAFLASGCGSPVAVSDYISLKLSGIKEGDVRNGYVSESKNVNTEEGNPYADFLRVVDEHLEGESPSLIEIDSVALQVHSESKGIVDFITVFETLEIFISTSDTTASLGNVELTSESTLTLEDVTNENLVTVQEALREGSFKLGVRGGAQENLPDDFELRISLDVQFSAYP